MELFVFVAALVSLAVLSGLFGVDSRPGVDDVRPNW
jgi:hypothetical protein